MKKFFKKLWDIMNSPKYEKQFMVALPCIAILISLLILSPQIKTIYRMIKSQEVRVQEVVSTEAPAISPAPTAIPIPIQTAESEATPAPTASPEPTPAPKTATYLDAVSIQRDLYIKLYEENGRQIKDTDTKIRLNYPSGESYVFGADSDGGFYIVNLESGEYSVDMVEHERYETAESITRTVKAKVQYEQIKELDSIVHVNTLEELYAPEELEAELPVTLVPDVIETPPEAVGTDNVITEEKPVVDENGNQTYTYTFNLGPNGYILLKGTQTESETIPVDEDNDGIVDYGMTKVTPDASNGSTVPYYVSETLFNADNTPVEKYDIIAVPVTETQSRRIGWQNIDGSMYYFDSEGNTVKGLMEIDGKLYYFNQFGVKASQLGIDVSFYNEDINWQAVKAYGIDYAIIRVGGRTWEQGKLYYDSKAEEYLRKAQAAGLKIGVYFYSTAINELEAVQEASLALEVVNGRSLDMPIYIDMEYSGMYPNARADKLDMATRSEVLTAFCKTIENSGYRAGVYSGEYFYRDNIDFNAISKYHIWLANYTNDNKLPTFSKRYDMWQFTDSGQVKGINCGVDMNVIF